MMFGYTGRYQSTSEFIQAMRSVPIKRQNVKLPKNPPPSADTENPVKKLLAKLFGG